MTSVDIEASGEARLGARLLRPSDSEWNEAVAESIGFALPDRAEFELNSIPGVQYVMPLEMAKLINNPSDQESNLLAQADTVMEGAIGENPQLRSVRSDVTLRADQVLFRPDGDDLVLRIMLTDKRKRRGHYQVTEERSLLRSAIGLQVGDWSGSRAPRVSTVMGCVKIKGNRLASEQTRDRIIRGMARRGLLDVTLHKLQASVTCFYEGEVTE